MSLHYWLGRNERSVYTFRPMARREQCWSRFLADAAARLPLEKAVAQQAFVSERTRPVMVKLSELRAGFFYWFAEMVASALFDATVEHAVRGGRRLTVGYTSMAQLRAHSHRLQRLAARLEQVRVLVAGDAGSELLRSARLECHNTSRSVLATHRIALVEGGVPVAFVAREQRVGRSLQCLGFFTGDGELVSEIGDDVDAVLRRMSRRFETFEQLETLHQATQRVASELEQYTRRLQRDVARVRRCPRLLTPARFERIVTQAVQKMEQLKEIPSEALRTIGGKRR